MSLNSGGAVQDRWTTTFVERTGRESTRPEDSIILGPLTPSLLGL
jgi:hypothetical protein